MPPANPIYLFDAETTSRPECYGSAEAWPPVLTRESRRGRHRESDLLGTTPAAMVRLRSPMPGTRCTSTRTKEVPGEVPQRQRVRRHLAGRQAEWRTGVELVADPVVIRQAL